MKFGKKSVVLPLILLAYLAIMAYIGLPYYRAGEYLYYFGVIGISLFVIVLLRYSLKKKERMQKEREMDIEYNDNLREVAAHDQQSKSQRDEPSND